MMGGVGAAEARIASIQARFAFSDRWVYDPEPVAPYRTGGLYVGSSVADVAAPGDAVDPGDAFAPNATAPNATGPDASERDGAAAIVAPADLSRPQHRSDPAATARLDVRARAIVVAAARRRRVDPAPARGRAPVGGSGRRRRTSQRDRARAARRRSPGPSPGSDADARADDGALGPAPADAPTRPSAWASMPGCRWTTSPVVRVSCARLLDAADGRVQEAVAAHHAGEPVGLGQRDGWSTATTAYVDTVMERRSSVLGRAVAPGPPEPTPSTDTATTSARATAAGWMAR